MRFPRWKLRGKQGGKKQSESSTTNIPLNFLMISTSPYSSSLQLAIKFLMGVDGCSRLSTGQVIRSCIKTCTICYFQWYLTHAEGTAKYCKFLSFLLFFSSLFIYFDLTKKHSQKNQVSESDIRNKVYNISFKIYIIFIHYKQRLF